MEPHTQSALGRLKGKPDKELTPAARVLRIWMIKNDMTVPQLAIRTGFAASTLYQYVCGQPKAIPSLAQAFAIEWETHGAVAAYMWLDNPFMEARIREHQLAGSKRMERSSKAFVLKFNSLKTADGVIRQKARVLSRLFGVEWGEVKRRVWADAKVRALAEVANVSHLLGEIDHES